MNHVPTAFQRCILAVLCMALFAVLLHSTGYAKECEEALCKEIKVQNYTDYEFKIHFLLCCDGEYRETDCEAVPLEGAHFDFPDGCTMLKFGFCSRLPRGVCAKWDETECVIKMVYCN